MKLEDKKAILKKIKRLPDQIDGYTICSFKKDRSIKAYTQNTEKGIIYFLHEEGYDTQTFMFTEKKEFHKQMKKLIEKEFPRSHKLYVNQQF
ncbi:hypothetical protein I131_05185 [Enterococcus faecium CRL1879]|nr:hypothetical protein I131_05185 [Enterococcus faecium CRL1879]